MCRSTKRVSAASTVSAPSRRPAVIAASSAGAVGVAISTVTADDKVKEHQLFADVEANKYLRGGVFLGAGFSMWDLTRSETVTPAWMAHVGVPLGRNAKYPVYLLAEGRQFLDQADDLSNNYLVWGGVRVRF